MKQGELKQRWQKIQHQATQPAMWKRKLRNICQRYAPFSLTAKHRLTQWINQSSYHRQHQQMVQSYESALQWFHQHQIDSGGVAISAKQQSPYPEVSGYIVPTLYQWGEKHLAQDIVRWLVTQQNPDGSFSAPDGTPYTFDTGQVIRGLLKAMDDVPEAEVALRRACDWLLIQVEADGRLNTPSTAMWGTLADDRIHLYVLSPLRDAGLKLNSDQYQATVSKVLNHYKKRSDLLSFNTLSHFCAYIWEALCDLDETALAHQALEQAITLQKPNGSIPAYAEQDWVCTTGVAQLAIIGYKLGKYDFAHKAFDYLCSVQNPTGGFYGSLGQGANYFFDDENSWTVKYFLDALLCKQQANFDLNVSDFPKSIVEGDGRVKAITDFLGDINNLKILDAGCGHGRYLKVLKNLYPQAQLHGMDLSPQMLKIEQDHFNLKQGSLLDAPYPDQSFDAIYCVEALEHALRPRRAIFELLRMLKPGGKLILIDKNIRQLGRIILDPLEQWFDPDEMIQFLKQHLENVQAKSIAYDQKQPDGLFYAWEGKKR